MRRNSQLQNKTSSSIACKRLVFIEENATTQNIDLLSFSVDSNEAFRTHKKIGVTPNCTKNWKDKKHELDEHSGGYKVFISNYVSEHPLMSSIDKITNDKLI